MGAGHFIRKCKLCQSVISQCRCPSYTYTITTLGVCKKCEGTKEKLSIDEALKETGKVQLSSETPYQEAIHGCVYAKVEGAVLYWFTLGGKRVQPVSLCLITSKDWIAYYEPSP